MDCNEAFLSIFYGLITGLISGLVATWIYDAQSKKKKSKRIEEILRPFLDKELFGYWKNDCNPGKEAFIGKFTYMGNGVVQLKCNRIGKDSNDVLIGSILMSHDLIGYGKGAYSQTKSRHKGFAFPEIWIVADEIVMNAPYIKSADHRESREWIPQAFVWTEKL